MKILMNRSLYTKASVCETKISQVSYGAVDKFNMELQSMGLAGLEKAQEKLQQSAKRLAAATGYGASDRPAGSPSDVVDLSAEMVALSQASLMSEVNLKVVETANELSSRTIDILA
jgi:hypothetical protein